MDREFNKDDMLEWDPNLRQFVDEALEGLDAQIEAAMNKMNNKKAKKAKKEKEAA